MEDIRRLWVLFVLVLINCTGVTAPSPELVGLAVSGSISFVLLFFVIFMIGVSFSWTGWVGEWMKARGKVRMPKAYWKRKEELKRRLLSGAASYTSGPGSAVNGSLPQATVDRASLVQAWSQQSKAHNNNAFEEKDVVLEFGPEQEDEFQIETSVCDDEVLDVGPFKGAKSNETPAAGQVYSEPYIYSTNDRQTSFRKKEAEAATATTAPANAATTAASSTSAVIEVNSSTTQAATSSKPDQETVTHFEESLVRL